MTKRKAIPKKVRFEVFKRDKFTCQYCGAKAPDVVLHIDHIKPVAHDGDNDIMNLVTACEDCNQGKGARELSDDSAVRVRREQAEKLAERREQIEMMAEWQLGLAEAESDMVNAANELLIKVSGSGVNSNGEKTLRKYIERFGFSETMEAIRISFGQYEHDTDDGWEHAFSKVGGICYNRSHKLCSQCVHCGGPTGDGMYYCNNPRLIEGVTTYNKEAEDCRDFERFNKPTGEGNGR